ncbi:MAG: hypothetical protein IJZ88_03980 [Clostridia bacterium]|nr:hypothetical protein [Clostridia bacterium]
MERTITDLSTDYFKAAADMDYLIKKVTTKIKLAMADGETDKCYKLKQKRQAFYAQKSELLALAYKLANYYNKEEDLYESA